WHFLVRVHAGIHDRPSPTPGLQSGVNGASHFGGGRAWKRPWSPGRRDVRKAAPVRLQLPLYALLRAECLQRDEHRVARLPRLTWSWPPNVACDDRRDWRIWTASNAYSGTTSPSSNTTVTKWRCYLHFWPSGTKDAAWPCRQAWFSPSGAAFLKIR